MPLRQVELAPLASNCLRPCKTPPIRVSSRTGDHTALKLLATAFSLASTPRRLQVNSLAVGLILKGCHRKAPFQFLIVSSERSFNRPDLENARSHAAGTCCDAGRIRE